MVNHYHRSTLLPLGSGFMYRLLCRKGTYCQKKGKSRERRSRRLAVAFIPSCRSRKRCFRYYPSHMPETFVIGMVYILAALLILGAVNLFITLARSKQYAHVPVYLWLLPTLVLIVAIFSIHKPIEAAALPLKVIGWAFMCYGVIELLFSIRNFYIRKAFEKAEESKIVEGFKLANEDIEDAEIIEEEKPTT